MQYNLIFEDFNIRYFTFFASISDRHVFDANLMSYYLILPNNIKYKYKLYNVFKFLCYLELIYNITNLY